MFTLSNSGPDATGKRIQSSETGEKGWLAFGINFSEESFNI